MVCPAGQHAEHNLAVPQNPFFYETFAYSNFFLELNELGLSDFNSIDLGIFLNDH